MKYIKAIHVILVYAYFSLALWLAFSFASVTYAFMRVIIATNVAQAEALSMIARAVHGA